MVSRNRPDGEMMSFGSPSRFSSVKNCATSARRCAFVSAMVRPESSEPSAHVRNGASNSAGVAIVPPTGRWRGARDWRGQGCQGALAMTTQASDHMRRLHRLLLAKSDRTGCEESLRNELDHDRS